jgi:hypothetical protein
MKLLFFFITFLFACSSCRKNVPTARVTIRIKNTTTLTLNDVKLTYDATSYNYGSLSPNNISAYQTFNQIADDPAIEAKSGGDNFHAGPLIPPNTHPIPLLGNGKYTLEIFTDTSLFFGYNARYVKN